MHLIQGQTHSKFSTDGTQLSLYEFIIAWAMKCSRKWKPSSWRSMLYVLPKWFKSSLLILCVKACWKAVGSRDKQCPRLLPGSLGGHLYFFGSLASQMNSGVTRLEKKRNYGVSLINSLLLETPAALLATEMKACETLFRCWPLGLRESTQEEEEKGSVIG